jgi:hypothetical protein
VWHPNFFHFEWKCVLIAGVNIACICMSLHGLLITSAVYIPLMRAVILNVCVLQMLLSKIEGTTPRLLDISTIPELGNIG